MTKGEPTGGAVLFLLRARDGTVTIIGRSMTGTGEIGWSPLLENVNERDESVNHVLDKQRKYDPDLWVVELDIADSARFIDELPAMS